jgi:hypothetical protein
VLIRGTQVTEVTLRKWACFAEKFSGIRGSLVEAVADGCRSALGWTTGARAKRYWTATARVLPPLCCRILRMSGLVLTLFLFIPTTGQLRAGDSTPYGPRINFDKDYAQPTITSIGPFEPMTGRPPRLHIHIQYKRMQYVCSSKSATVPEKAGLRVGTKVEIREQGTYLWVRRIGEKKWLKLALIEKSELHNL